MKNDNILLTSFKILPFKACHHLRPNPSCKNKAYESLFNNKDVILRKAQNSAWLVRCVNPSAADATGGDPEIRARSGVLLTKSDSVLLVNPMPTGF